MKQYDADFFRWTQETSDQLRRGDFARIDVSALVEEVEDLGKREKSALQSRVAVLVSEVGSPTRQEVKELASHNPASAKPDRAAAEAKSQLAAFPVRDSSRRIFGSSSTGDQRHGAG